jgi:hypothetical protein
MSESATPEAGGLTVDQAIASLVSPPPEEQAPAEAPVEAAESEEQPNTEGEASSPEGAEDGAETPAEETEAEAEQPEAVAPLDPPKYWSQDAKAKFAELPPELQAVVLQQEGPREEAAAKAKAEAAEQVKAANAELTKVQSLAVALNERLPQWIQAFESRWGQNPDWVAFAQEHGVEAMTLAKTQFEAERQQLQAAAEETHKAQRLAHEQYVKTEFARLAEIEPDLAPSTADPKQGADKRQGVVKFLIERGIPQDAIAQISATEMSLAYDAMRWREAQAALKAAPKPKPAAPAPKAPVRPAAAVPQQSSDPARKAANRFAQTRSIDDAVALLLSRKR